MGRAIHHGLVGPENILRAVAVMDVEIDDRGAGKAVLLLRVARGDGGVVEEAEAHRLRRLGMMAGRPRGDEGVDGLVGQDFVDGVDGAAGRAQRRLEAAGRHRGVGVDAHQAFVRRGVADLQHIVHRVAQRDRLERRLRRGNARQRLEFFRFERVLDGAQPLRPFGMAGRRQVLQTGRVGDQQRGHYGELRALEFGDCLLATQARRRRRRRRPRLRRWCVRAPPRGRRNSRQKTAPARCARRRRR